MRLYALAAVLLSLGCRPATPTITGKEWIVVAVGDRIAPVGAGGKMLTLTLDDSTHHAYGFAGCNQYNANYTLTDSALTFGPVMSTKMACLESMEIEMVFLSTLPYVTNWQQPDSILTLTSSGGVVVKLRLGQH